MAQQSESQNDEFIPARESPLFISAFRWYVRWLFHRRFQKVWLHQSYVPAKDESTLYYLNHTSWWDGLIPFLLNEFCFKQKARAVMEDKQMLEYPFFSRIGAFSINRSNPRSALNSLRYGLQSLEPAGRSLFIYPEGKIYPQEDSPNNFEGGLAWMTNRLPDLKNVVKVVPIGIYIHTMTSAKPTLMLNVTNAIAVDSPVSKQSLSSNLKEQLHNAVIANKKSVRKPEKLYRPFP